MLKKYGKNGAITTRNVTQRAHVPIKMCSRYTFHHMTDSTIKPWKN